MWKSAVLSLSIVIMSCNLREVSALPKLGNVKTITMGQENEHIVWIEWSFDNPAEVSLENVEFVIELISRGLESRRLSYRTRTRPLRYRIGDVKAGRAYIVKIKAMSPNWENSDPSYFAFDCMDKDWPSPSIISVTASRQKDSGMYFVVWSKISKLRLSRIELEVCDHRCSRFVRQPTDQSALVPVEFGSKFTVRVAACYDIAVVGKIERFSEYYYGQSGSFPQERVLDSVEGASQVGNRIKLEWHPPIASDGPKSFYDVFVCDPRYGASFFDRFRASFGEDTPAPLHVYRMRVDGDDEEEPVHRFSREMHPEAVQCPPFKSLLFAVIKRTLSAVRFRIIFQDRSSTTNKAGKKRHLLIGPGVAEMFGLSAYSPLIYGIRSCITYRRGGDDICGNFTMFRVISNVAGPSPVQWLSWRFKNLDTLEISWKEPADPRGPIDGYRVEIEVTYGASVRTRMVVLDRFARSYILKNFNERKKYRIGVAAFNLDTENKNKQLMGEFRYVFPHEALLVKYATWITITLFVFLLLSALIVRLCFRGRDQGEYPPSLELQPTRRV